MEGDNRVHHQIDLAHSRGGRLAGTGAGGGGGGDRCARCLEGGVIVMGGSVFTPAEIAYLHEGHRLGRVASVGRDGTPHVVPSGWTHNREMDTIDVTGRAVENTKKFRDVVRSGRAAIVIDDIASVNPFRPRAIEVRGAAEAVREPEALIRIHPRRIVSWGIEDRAQARTVNADRAADRLCTEGPDCEKEEDNH